MTYNEIMYQIPKKRLLALRDARMERLLNEQEEQKKQAAEQERLAIHNQILNP